MLIRFLGLFCFYALFATVLQADVIEPVDVFVEGDGKATYIEATDLKWLDLPLTVGMSYQEVLGDPTLTGILDNTWRIADLSEVDAMFTEYGFTPDSNCQNGASHCSGGGESRSVVAAIISDFDSPTSASFGGFFTNPNAQNEMVGQAYADSGFTVDATTEQLVPWTSKKIAGVSQFNGHGVFLVSPMLPIPEPSTVFLLLIASGLVFMNRCRYCR